MNEKKLRKGGEKKRKMDEKKLEKGKRKKRINR